MESNQTGHLFTRPGQVAPDRPARDACMVCGGPEAAHLAAVSPDQRVTSAREYLASVRQHKVTALPPSVLVRECAELRRQLGQVLDAIDQAADLDDLTDLPAEPSPYCKTCGEWVGRFLGMEGWHHFTGDGSPGSKRELYAADHEAVIGWIVP